MRLLLAFLLLCCITSVAKAENWPGWRGLRGDGTSEERNVPTKWNGETGENILWKVLTPGGGHSSPIVWDDHLFLTACDDATQERLLVAYDKTTGEKRWQQTVLKAPLEKKHALNSFASGTPATDGKLIYVTFLAPEFSSLTERTPGDMVVAAYDFSGRQKWLVCPGRFASVHGFCSSPVLFEDMVILNGDHDGDSYVVALNKHTGEQVWKFDRVHKTRSYCTPIIREIDGRTQMIFSGSKCVTSLDPRTGREHWSMQGPTEQFVASLVYNGKLLFLTAGFPQRHVLAIKPDGHGDVTETHIAWRSQKGASYVPSPIACGDYFLVASDEGIGSCFEAETGERQWQQRLGKHYSASLVTAGGLVYFLADDGIMKVVRPGKKLEVVAENPLGEYIYASPAISDGRLYLRGEKHLICVGEK
jgi:outer membrane protein assembly factor BamB